MISLASPQPLVVKLATVAFATTDKGQLMSLPETEVSERRTGTQDVLDKLLAERQQMLVLFCRVAGMGSYEKAKADTQLLQDFCQILVDYSAFVHFEIYQRIVNGAERRAKVIEVAEEVYDRIVEASEVAVAFNDKYDAADHTLDLGHLTADLSQLGEEIATRIEMEDRILQALMAR
jgi:regulator of sigma D